MESPNKMIKMDKDNDKESEPVKQNAYLRLMMNHKEIMKNHVEIMKNHKEIMKIHEKITKNYEKRLRIHKILRKKLHNKHNISDKELEITRTDFIEKNIMNKFLELEGEMLKFVFEDQQYTEMIEKLCCNEDICVKCQQDEDKSIDTKQKIKHEEDESDIHMMLLNRIMKLYTEIEWWLQRVEENQIALMTLITEKHKTEIELMKLATKVTKLQNLCNSYEKEKTNLQLKNKNIKTSGMESFNLSTLQKSILEEKNQQISPNTKTNNAMELLKQISNSLNELFQNYEDKMKELNKCTVKVTEVLKDPKTNDKSTFVEEQVPTFTEDLNKSDKADESSEQVDKDALIELLIDSKEKVNKILNKEIRATKLLKDIKME